MLKLNEIKKLTNNHSVSAKSGTLQVYTFSGEGGSSDHLPMKQKRKTTKMVSKYPFQLFERKNTKSKIESPYSDQLQTAVKGTNHTVTTAENKIIHRKLISKPITPFEQENSNRGTGPSRPDGRFARKEDKSPATHELSQSQDEQTYSSPETPNNRKCGTFGRGKPRFIRNREVSASPKKQPGTSRNKPVGPLTINTEQISASDIERVINDTQQSGQDLHIKDINGKVSSTIDSDLELASNLSSITEIDKNLEITQETNLRRSKRLTKTNPVSRLNNPVNQSDYRKHRKTSKLVTTTGDNRRNARAGKRRQPVIRSQTQTLQPMENNNANHGYPDTTQRRGRYTDHSINLDGNGNQLDTSHPITEGEMKNSLIA